MNKNKSAFARLACLLALLVPLLAPAFPVYPPSAGAAADVGGTQVPNCSSVNQPSHAACATGGSGIAGDGLAYVASASSSASLGSGDLVVQASVTGDINTNPIGVAALTDTLFFHGTVAPGARLIVNLTAGGGLAGTAQADLNFTGFWADGGSFTHTQASTLQLGSSCITDPVSTVVTCETSSGGALDVNVNLPLSLLGNGYNFVANLSCQAYGGVTPGSCSYDDPFTVTLPQGVTFTSASGVFLTSPVPLPASAWLLLSGLGGFALLGRRRGVKEAKTAS